MLAKVYSAAVLGVDAYEVELEVNGAPGKPVVVVVGLPDTAVKESKDRVTTAVTNSGYRWPRGRCTVNLAPAHIAGYIAKRENTTLHANKPRIVRLSSLRTPYRANRLVRPESSR